MESQAHSSFPALLFIDNFTFIERRMRVRNPDIIMPQALLLELEPYVRVHQDVEVFFSSVHSFLPIGMTTLSSNLRPFAPDVVA